MKRITTRTTGMMTTRSRWAVVLVSSAVAVTPPTSASGIHVFHLRAERFHGLLSLNRVRGIVQGGVDQHLAVAYGRLAGAPGAPVMGTAFGQQVSVTDAVGRLDLSSTCCASPWEATTTAGLPLPASKWRASASWPSRRRMR
jgi:hypothetical protein